ncbi:MAG: hypothetical protein ACRD0V_07820 [Acidimicrobiales bacterium]
MSDQTPPDAYGQGPPRPQQPDSPPPPGAPPPGYQYPPSGYGQHYPGYAPPAPRKPLDLPKLVFIGAWVVLGLYGLWFIYTLTQDDFGADFGDRLFGSLQNLATGIFYAAVLLAVSVWLGQQTTTD